MQIQNVYFGRVITAEKKFSVSPQQKAAAKAIDNFSTSFEKTHLDQQAYEPFVHSIGRLKAIAGIPGFKESFDIKKQLPKSYSLNAESINDGSLSIDLKVPSKDIAPAKAYLRSRGFKIIP